MYYLLYFDIESTESLRYPLPQTIDIARLDESLELQEKMQFLLPEPEDSSVESILKCWKACLENLIDIISQTEKRVLVFPTDNHLKLFHIIKSKCKLHTRSSGSIALERQDDELPYANSTDASLVIDKMISFARSVGTENLATKPNAAPSATPTTKPKSAPEKEDKAKRGIANCDSYSHIVDTRTGEFHKKDSKCLQRIPVSFWRGVGKSPSKRGFTPCSRCYGKLIDTIISEPSNEIAAITQETEKRLIDGNYATTKSIIARCHILRHRGYLTKSLIKKHCCIEKECTFFEKLKPEYWIALERAEKDRKSERSKVKESKKQVKDRDIFIRETLEDSGCIYVTSIREETRNLLTISYIFDRKVNLMPEILFLRKELGKTIKLQARIGSDEALEKLIRKRRRETRKVTDLRKAPGVGDATKKRLASLGVFCLEDLFGRNGDVLYGLDCKQSGESVNRRYLSAYSSAVEFANGIEK